MAEKRIDDFSEASAFEDGDKLLVDKLGVTLTILGSKIKAYCQNAISTLVAQVNADATAAAAAKTAAEASQTAAASSASSAASSLNSVKLAANHFSSYLVDQQVIINNSVTSAQDAATEAQGYAAAMQECAPYDSAKAYAVGNMATYNGSTYRCTTACTGVAPTTTSNWLLIAAKGADGQGTGDMQAATYDPAGGAKQVAFATDVNSALAGKQAALTFDASPTAGSTNPVTSGGVKTAIDAKADATALSAHTGSTSNPHGVTAAQAGADPTGTAAGLINRSNAVNVANTSYTTLMARGIILMDATTYDAVTDWSTVLVNGAIALRYE